MARKSLPEKLNICLVAGKFPILGRAADKGFLWPIARGLAAKGHDVTVLSWKNPDHRTEIHKEGVNAFFVGEGSNAGLNRFPEFAERKFAELHAQKPFHLVHSVDAGGLNIGLNRKMYSIAVAYDVEATQMSQLYSILGMSQETLGSLMSTAINVAYKFLTTYFSTDRKLLKTADAVFVTSPQQLLTLERYYLYPESKVHIVPYGIEIGDLSPRERSEELRSNLGLPANAQIVVTVSDMTELGEMKNLFRAFEKVAVKKPNARLIVVGYGPLFKQIEFEMLNLALGSRVTFTGAVPNPQLPDYISLADIFVNLSSRTSGFEPSLLEAMAQKKIIIGSEVSPISTIVEAGRDGFLIRPADISSLSNLILRIFNSEIEVVPIKERAREKVTQLFDNERMVQITLAAYYRALQRSGYYKRQRLPLILTPQITHRAT